jgi:CHASE3 domain sensor protein
MKKVISLFTLIILFTFGMNTASFADTTSDSIAKVEAEIAAKAKSDSADKLKAEKEIAPKAVNKVKVGSFT